MPKKVTNNSTRILRIAVPTGADDKALYVTFLPGDNVVSDEDWKKCMENERARKWCEKGTLKGRTGKIQKNRALLEFEDEKSAKPTTRAKRGAKVDIPKDKDKDKDD